jgi:hypothetical protein
VAEAGTGRVVGESPSLTSGSVASDWLMLVDVDWERDAWSMMGAVAEAGTGRVVGAEVPWAVASRRTARGLKK